MFHATALNSLPGNTTDSKSDIQRLGQFSEFRGLCEDLIQYTQCISHSASKKHVGIRRFDIRNWLSFAEMLQVYEKDLNTGIYAHGIPALLQKIKVKRLITQLPLASASCPLVLVYVGLGNHSLVCDIYFAVTLATGTLYHPGNTGKKIWLCPSRISSWESNYWQPQKIATLHHIPSDQVLFF